MSDSEWETHLQPLFAELTKGLRVSGALLDLLVQKKLLTFEERERVDKVSSNTEAEKVRCLIELLMRKPKGTFHEFCSVLEDPRIGRKDLAERLRSGDKDGDKAQPKSSQDRIANDDAEAKHPAARARDVQAVEDDAHVTTLQIQKISEALGTQWHEIGIYLGFSGEELEQKREEYIKLSRRLFAILDKWRRGKGATEKALMEACRKAKVEGAAERALKS